jgi:hypothetical protein
MPVLRNNRYNAFEYGAPRDELRGLPLTQFPWVLERGEVSTHAEQMHWNFEMLCTNATPSGFGSKLHFEVSVTAHLSSESVGRLGFANDGSSRIRSLFSLERFTLEESDTVTLEGALEDLSKMTAELKKSFLRRLRESWPPHKAQKHLRSQFQFKSPGGFGQTEH